MAAIMASMMLISQLCTVAPQLHTGGGRPCMHGPGFFAYWSASLEDLLSRQHGAVAFNKQGACAGSPGLALCTHACSDT
jgi:hypothetical protein